MDPRPSKGRARRVLRLLIPGTALLVLAWVAQDAVRAVVTEPDRVRWRWVAAALGLNLAYRAANAINFARVVGALGATLDASSSLRLWLRSELLRWLPGGVWGYLSRARQLTKAGVPAAVGAAAVPLEILLTLAAWATVALVSILYSGVAEEWAGHLGATQNLLLLASGLLVSGAAFTWWAWPRARARWEPLRAVRIDRRRAVLAYGYYTLLNTVRGLGFACVLLAVAPAQPPLSVSIGANAVAWLVGFAFILAPGGVGIREAALALLLRPWLPLEDAAFAALLWRAAQVAEEVALLPIALRGVEAPPVVAGRPTEGRAAVSWVVGLVAIGGVVWFVASILIPGWKRPISRSFDGPFGYGSVVRAADGGFALDSARVERRRFEIRYLGEGRIHSDTILVPIIPMALVREVAVEVGQAVKKGDLFIELDDAHAQVRLASATAAVSKAQAELERRRAGSHQTQVFERPELHRTNLEYRKREEELATEVLSLYEGLESDGLVSRAELIDHIIQATAATREARTAEIVLQGSEASREHTLEVAAMGLEEARAVLREREIQLAAHAIRAPVDGVVRNVLVRTGEYNRNTGSTGVALSVGTWFEARLGQVALAGVSVGAPCLVHLEALAGVQFSGTLARIVPFVDNDIGGPETSRPIRPRGTGAPEWPSTFRVRIELDPKDGIQLVPGLTGYASILIEREGLGIPSSAVDALSPNEGLVFMVDGERAPPARRVDPGVVRAAPPGRWVQWGARRVLLGQRSDGWIEVLEGLEEGDEVLLGGHGVLRESDAVRVLGPGSER
jgi:multidrug resistance efflux pump